MLAIHSGEAGTDPANHLGRARGYARTIPQESETTVSFETAIDAHARELGINLTPSAPGYLNLCARTGNLYLTSGHTSAITGKLGAELTVEDGQRAAVESIKGLLASVHSAHGTLAGLKVVRLMACVNATPEFTEHGAVINGASDLIHTLFGQEFGYHARSALGFSSIPGGAAVEIEAVIEILS